MAQGATQRVRICLLLQPCAGVRLPQALNALNDMLREGPGGSEALLGSCSVGPAHVHYHTKQSGRVCQLLVLCAGDLSGGLPGSNVSKDDLPDGPKPGQALKNLPSGSAGSQVSSQVCCCTRLLAAVVVLETLLVCNAVAVRMYGAVWLDWQIIAHESCRSMHLMHVLLCRWARLPAKVAAWLTRLAVLPRTSRERTLSVSRAAQAGW